ncbi:hypothetical protein XELAEV_18033764mg [Xenopus laevis]|uniref:Uncharacterized protein n=1 Tax=Xenopus laevis TaxID=8355 RepID=A0A974CL91_XENLA|nr:hypothetical protein XELAEV_18033764mg [Xenopus laevis]
MAAAILNRELLELFTQVCQWLELKLTLVGERANCHRHWRRHTRDPKLCDFFCTWHRSDCWNVNCALTVAGKDQIPREQRNEWILGQFRCVEHYQMKHVELLLIY